MVPNSGTFFWTDGTNCYDRRVKEKEDESKNLVTWESYDEYNHLNNVNSLHSKMEEREKKCHGVADKYLPRYCTLWAKAHVRSAMDLSDKVRVDWAFMKKEEMINVPRLRISRP